MWFPHIAIGFVFVLDMVILYFLAVSFRWYSIVCNSSSDVAISGHISLRYSVVQRGTQQEISAKKRAFTRRYWATLGRVNEASFQVMFICKYKLLIAARIICEGNERLTVE